MWTLEASSVGLGSMINKALGADHLSRKTASSWMSVMLVSKIPLTCFKEASSHKRWWYLSENIFLEAKEQCLLLKERYYKSYFKLSITKWLAEHFLQTIHYLLRFSLIISFGPIRTKICWNTIQKTAYVKNSIIFMFTWIYTNVAFLKSVHINCTKWQVSL
jgi:hypothetical protein